MLSSIGNTSRPDGLVSDVVQKQRPARLNRPLVIGLLLSLSLHLLLLLLVRPLSHGGERVSLVIQARLMQPPPARLAATAKPVKPAPRPQASPIHAPIVLEAIATKATVATAPTLPSAAQPPAPVTMETPPSAATTQNSPLAIDIDSHWYLAREVDVRPMSMTAIAPEYPALARRLGQEGTLKLMLRIDDLGRVQGVEVVEADVPGVFDQAALDAFRKARYQPAMKDGRPVRYQAFIRVSFKLQQ